MNTFVQDAGCETVFEDNKSDVRSNAISDLADLQLAMVGGGCGDVLWG